MIKNALQCHGQQAHKYRFSGSISRHVKTDDDETEWHGVLATAGLLPPPPPPPRVMLWLLDCEPATLAALAQHTDAVSAVALSLYWVGVDNATGAATLIDVPGGKSCAEAVHTALPELEVWAWVNGGHVGPSWPIKSAAQQVAMMNALFARPGPFVAS